MRNKLFYITCCFANEQKENKQSLEQKANDPTASLMLAQILNFYCGDFHNLNNASGDTVLLQSAVPFTISSLNHIAQGTLPIVADSPSDDSGLGDLVFLDLVVFNES